MTKKGALLRTLYARTTINGKRTWIAVGSINKKGKTKVYLSPEEIAELFD